MGLDKSWISKDDSCEIGGYDRF